MQETNKLEISPIPPPEGGGDWLTFCPCPFYEQDTIKPWFKKFIGQSASKSREILKNEWDAIKNQGVKAFAEALLKMHTCGILISKIPNYGENAWLVISCYPLTSGIIDAIKKRSTPPGVFYLLPPHEVPKGFELPANDIIRNFIFWFGGLCLAPPFMSSCFSRSIYGPPEEESGDVVEINGPEWDDLIWLYASLNGDYLVSNKENKIGWLSHESKKIFSVNLNFEEFLRQIASGHIPNPFLKNSVTSVLNIFYQYLPEELRLCHFYNSKTKRSSSSASPTRKAWRGT